MTSKIKFLIARLKTRIAQNKCYNDMESRLDAVFGMCCGKWYVIGDADYPEKKCTECRYYRGKR